MQELLQHMEEARSVRSIPYSELSLPYSSIGHLLSSRTAENPDALWMIFCDSDGSRSEFSYQSFSHFVQNTVRFLQSANVKPGDRIAVAGHNHPDTVIQYYAAWWIGATVVPMNMGEDDERLDYILHNSGAVVGFVRDEYLDRVLSLPTSVSGLKTVVVSGQPRGGFYSFAEILSVPNSEELLYVPDLLNQECLIVYTSGTTGLPKGVQLAQGNILADACGLADWHKIGPETRMMCVLPIHHVNGIVVTLVTPMYAGSSVVLNRKFQTSQFFSRLAAERVAVVSVVPTLLAFLLSGDINTSEYDLSDFRHIICGAGPLTCELAERFENRYHIPVIHGYGLSETTCYSCFLPVELTSEKRMEWLTIHGFPSIGVPIPQNEMAIHDDNGSALGPGERGEIVIRGHNVMMGYYQNRQANTEAFAHGWFRSGDEGFYLEDAFDHRHYFFITGRLKELIIRGGVNISPLEIDEVINSHPMVDAGIAVGFENNWYGEEVGAYVRRADPELTAGELLEYCREHLPFFKTPKVVVFGDDIPVTSTGKYQRNRVRHHFLEFREQHYSHN